MIRQSRKNRFYRKQRQVDKWETMARKHIESCGVCEEYADVVDCDEVDNE